MCQVQTKGSGPPTLLARPFPQPQQSSHLCRQQRHRGDRHIAWLWLEKPARCPSSPAAVAIRLEEVPMPVARGALTQLSSARPGR